MILIGIGANLESPEHGSPLMTCRKAVDALAEEGLRVVARSRWYESAPVPASDQPWFVNGVVAVETPLGPAEVLARLHAIEARFGRVRGERNAARPIDLDLLVHGETVLDGAGGGPEVPHPRMAGRAFVVLPMAEVVPAGWRHPVSGQGIAEMRAALPADQTARPIPGPTPGAA